MGFFRLLGFFWANGDRIRLLLEKMLARLPQIGDGMERAGQGAKDISYVVRGGGGAFINAKLVVTQVAQAVDTCYQGLGDAADAIRDAKNMLKDVRVPTLEAGSTDINVPVINVNISVPSINYSYVRPFNDVAAYLQTGAQKIDSVASQFQTTAARLRDLANALETAGDDMELVGRLLKDGGTSLKQIAT